MRSCQGSNSHQIGKTDSKLGFINMVGTKRATTHQHRPSQGAQAARDSSFDEQSLSAASLVTVLGKNHQMPFKPMNSPLAHFEHRKSTQKTCRRSKSCCLRESPLLKTTGVPIPDSSAIVAQILHCQSLLCHKLEDIAYCLTN